MNEIIAAGTKRWFPALTLYLYTRDCFEETYKRIFVIGFVYKIFKFFHIEDEYMFILHS